MDVKEKLKAIIRPLYDKNSFVSSGCFKCKSGGAKCVECHIEAEVNYLIENGVTVKENAVIMESPPIPTVDEVKKAAVIFKNFCNSRNSNPETDCIECPIQEMCTSDPCTWEVQSDGV